MNKVKVLFVCTGNTCRSPMAEGILKQKCDFCDVLSEGIHAAEGEAASKQAVHVMEKRGIHIQSHKAATVNSSLIRSADVVLTMTEAHKQVLGLMYPEEKKIYTLAQFAGENTEVPDPFMGDVSLYESCAQEIERLIELALPKLNQMVQPT